jgi:hypothetical protein
MRRITAEIWDGGRIDLVDELIAEDLVDHIDDPGLEGTGRERYRANALMIRKAFPDSATRSSSASRKATLLSRTVGWWARTWA